MGVFIIYERANVIVRIHHAEVLQATSQLSFCRVCQRLANLEGITALPYVHMIVFAAGDLGFSLNYLYRRIG